jgi:hypothetical protein
MAKNYGTGVREPTGHGLPGYEGADIRTSRPAADIVWCEAAGCPKSQCVQCQKERHG